MAYFKDLSPCTYFSFHRANPRGSSWMGQLEDFAQPKPFPELVAVGWLDAVHPFATGRPPADVLEKLRRWRQIAWQPCTFMGFHDCELCNAMSGGSSHKNLFVPGDGTTYVAPEGIVHYVSAHRYCPPQEFCDAVLRCPEPNTPEFFLALQACGWDPDVAQYRPSASQATTPVVTPESVASERPPRSTFVRRLRQWLGAS